MNSLTKCKNLSSYANITRAVKGTAKINYMVNPLVSGIEQWPPPVLLSLHLSLGKIPTLTAGF